MKLSSRSKFLQFIKIHFAFLFALIASTIIIFSIPPPYFISPDISFHAGKIRLVSSGIFFVNPFSGEKIMYPEAFHWFWAGFNFIFKLSPENLFRVISFFSFSGVFTAFYLIIRELLPSKKLNYYFFFYFLMVYAPTSRYILVANPFNFSAVFMLFAVYFFVLYYQKDHFGWLYSSILFSTFALSIWWMHIFVIIPFAFVAVFFLHNYKKLLLHIIPLLLLVIIGFLPVIIQFFSLNKIIPAYNYSTQRYSWQFIAYKYFGNLLVKGNLQFKSEIFPFVVDGDWRKIVNGIQFFVFILGFNIYMVIYLSLNFKKLLKAERLTRFFLYLAILLLLLSFFVMYKGDMAHLRRVQFFGFIFLLVGFIQFSKKVSSRFLKVFSVFGLISFLFYFYFPAEALNYNQYSNEKRQTAQFLANEFGDDFPHVFMDYRVAEEFAAYANFYTFIGYKKGGVYYHQEEKRSAVLLKNYWEIKNNPTDSHLILEEFKVKYFVLSERFDSSELFEFAKKNGNILFKNVQYSVYLLKKTY